MGITTVVEVFLIVAFVGHIIAAMAVGWLVLVGYRYVASQSRVLGAIVAIAMLVRTALGLALFWISYLRLPVAESLQLGGGFWQVFQDATGTYQNAAWAAETHQLFSLDHALAAPVFLNVTTVWMMVVGISPAAGLYLNLCLYTLLVVLIVRFFAPVNDWRRDLPCIVSVTGYSFMPAILIHSTQPVKEELAYVLVAVLCLGTLTLVRVLRQRAMTPQARAAGAAAGAMLAIALFGMAGVRWYLAFIQWCALALVLALFAIRGRASSLSRYVTGSMAALVVGWLAIWGGAGNNFASVMPGLEGVSISADAPALRQIREWPSYLLLRVRMTRMGFLAAGGGTNIVIPLASDSAAGQARAAELVKAEAESAFSLQRQRAAARAATSPERTLTAAAPRVLTPVATITPPVTPPVNQFTAIARAIPVSISDELKAITWGLALLFVPISLVQATGGIAIGSGRGLLRVTDLDTIFLDAAMASMLALLWTRRRAIGDRLPLLVIGGILSGVTAVLLGYSVTNFGTLWRMRPLAIIPLWVMAVALSPQVDVPPEGAHVSLAEQ